MPGALIQPILPPSLVAITGINGFIAQHCADLLLSQGYHVVGTVRSPEKIPQVLQTHGNHANLSVVVVEDIASTKSIINALEDNPPSAILHLASPFHYNTTDFGKDLMIPAIQGSTAVLNAAKSLRKVRRVVHTNSFACIYDASKGPQPDKVYTSKDWSPLTYQDGIDAPNAAAAYRASKAVAERAAWDWMEDNKDAQFDLVGLNPGMVFGPYLPNMVPATTADINTSNQIIYSVVSVGPHGEVPPTKAPVWVSVSDTALAHVRALQTPEASGQRYLLAAGVYCNQEIADIAREVTRDVDHSIPLGNPGAREAKTHFSVNALETEKALSIAWQPMKDVLQKLLPQLRQI